MSDAERAPTGSAALVSTLLRGVAAQHDRMRAAEARRKLAELERRLGVETFRGTALEQLEDHLAERGTFCSVVLRLVETVESSGDEAVALARRRLPDRAVIALRVPALVAPWRARDPAPAPRLRRAVDPGCSRHGGRGGRDPAVGFCAEPRQSPGDGPANRGTTPPAHAARRPRAVARSLRADEAAPHAGRPRRRAARSAWRRPSAPRASRSGRW